MSNTDKILDYVQTGIDTILAQIEANQRAQALIAKAQSEGRDNTDAELDEAMSYREGKVAEFHATNRPAPE